jgi:circadian clock protein KaiC
MTDPAERPRLARVPTGIAGLDTLLRGGLIKARIYIVEGPPGVGKTVLGNQVCFNHAAAGGKALYVTLLAETHAMMMEHLEGMSFFDSAQIPDRLSYVNALSELQQDGLRGLGELIRGELQAGGISLLVVDGFIAAQEMAPSEVDLKRFIHDLQVQASVTDCTMLLLTSGGSHQRSAEYTMVDGVLEMRDQLYGWQAESDLLIRKFRGSGFLRGRHAYKITDDGIIVHARLEALYAHPSRRDRTGVAKISTGIEELDKLLEGGVPTASTTMVMGPSGSGKTTLGFHFLAKSGAEEPGLLFGFYETPERVATKARGVCSPLAPKLENGDVEVIWQPPIADLLDAFGERLLEAVHRRKVRRLFVDGLGGFERASLDPGRLNHFFTALANELRVLGVTTLYSAEVADILGPAIKAPLDGISAIAENLILLRFIERGSSLHRLMSILKIRDSRFDASLHRFVLTPEGINLDKTTEAAEAILSDIPVRSKGVAPRRRIRSSPEKTR